MSTQEWEGISSIMSSKNAKVKKEPLVHRPSYELMLQAMPPTQRLLYQEQQVSCEWAGPKQLSWECVILEI